MLVDTSGRRGEHGGRVYGIWRRRAPLGFGRARGGERAARREEVQRVEGGCVATHGGVQGVGDAGSQAGGGSGARVHAAGTRPPAHWQEVEDDREVEVGWAGFARLGCYSGGLVGPPGRFSLFLF